MLTVRALVSCRHCYLPQLVRKAHWADYQARDTILLEVLMFISATVVAMADSSSETMVAFDLSQLRI